MKKIIKWVAIILLALFVIGLLAPSSDKGTEEGATNQAQKAEATVYEVGQTIEAEGVEVQVVSVEEKTSVGGTWIEERASEGGVLVVVNWQYKNTSSEPLRPGRQPSIKLTDASGTVYRSDMGKTSSYAVEADLDRKILSDVNPGITVRDAEVFEVSQENFSQGGWLLIITSNRTDYQVAVN
jgi:hypothetical protein